MKGLTQKEDAMNSGKISENKLIIIKEFLVIRKYINWKKLTAFKRAFARCHGISYSTLQNCLNVYHEEVKS